MSNYQARITKTADGSFYALIVRIDRDGEENVIHGYKGRHFATVKAAQNQQTPTWQRLQHERNKLRWPRKGHRPQAGEAGRGNGDSFPCV